MVRLTVEPLLCPVVLPRLLAIIKEVLNFIAHGADLLRKLEHLTAPFMMRLSRSQHLELCRLPQQRIKLLTMLLLFLFRLHSVDFLISIVYEAVGGLIFMTLVDVLDPHVV